MFKTNLSQHNKIWRGGTKNWGALPLNAAPTVATGLSHWGSVFQNRAQALGKNAKTG